MFGPIIDTAAKAHALEQYPKEAVGVVVGGAYLPQENVHPEPTKFMRVRDGIFAELDIQGVIHSHVEPDPLAPSKEDMEAQIATDVPWGIVQVAKDGAGTGPVLWFGEQTLDIPLIGRPFVPGVTDCYSLVRAYFWQTRQLKLPDFPRSPEWWTAGENLLEEGFQRIGFVPIHPSKAQPGDCVGIAFPGTGPINHCGVLIDNGLLLHHLRDRLSRREPWNSGWRHLTRVVARYVEL